MISRIHYGDLEEIGQVEHAAHFMPWPTETFLEFFKAHYLNLKISTEERIAGFLITACVAPEATVLNLAVHPDFQKQGLGQRLLTHLQQQLFHTERFDTLWLEVRRSNHAAQRLYQRCGFQPVQHRKAYYPTLQGGYEDAIVMRCDAKVCHRIVDTA